MSALSLDSPAILIQTPKTYIPLRAKSGLSASLVYRDVATPFRVTYHAHYSAPLSPDPYEGLTALLDLRIVALYLCAEPHVLGSNVVWHSQ